MAKVIVGDKVKIVRGCTPYYNTGDEAVLTRAEGAVWYGTVNGGETWCLGFNGFDFKKIRTKTGEVTMMDRFISSEILIGIVIGIILGVIVGVSMAKGATYGNDCAALGVVSATSSAAWTATTDTTEVRK
ncbi:MAG: hypothetical protein HGA87_02450 [Desulfobulbaceae bacterium]|nr:hypothetical protein [Desulfobulbaceae bacterium]